MSRARNTLVIMTRRPRWGCGKRRLADALGPGLAWHFQRFALEALLRRLGKDRRWDLEVAVTPDRAARGSGRWAAGARRLPQGPGDLGARMLRQLAGEPGRLGARLLIGADIPGVTPQLIATAFDLLKSHDWVIGPAADGGFWAIGARRCPWRPPDFEGVAWSTPSVFTETRLRLRGSLALLPLLADVDEPEALRLWRRGSALQLSDPRCKSGAATTHQSG